jgi:citrate synthase
MASQRYLTAKEAAEKLNVTAATLYAYVSRGLLRSEATDDKRQRRYYAEDVDKLLTRREARRNPESVAKEALQWGAPVLESAITLIAEGRFYYRGHDALELAQTSTAEEVAALLWTGDMQEAARLFEGTVTARPYELMLLHLEMDGAALSPLAMLQTFLPVAATDDPGAYDLRPQTVAYTGARILRLMTSVVAGDVPEDMSLAAMLQRGWAPEDEQAERLFNTALILCADHELNVSAFAARTVASAGSTPYGAVMGGLAALQGYRHGGHTVRVEAMLREATTPAAIRDVIAKRLQRGEFVPGFGHKLYPQGDPRAQLLLKLVQEAYPDSDAVAKATAAVKAAAELLREAPTVDFMLVTLCDALGLPEGSAIALFALGRTIGWIGHAIEQYSDGQMIRPRALYRGEQP